MSSARVYPRRNLGFGEGWGRSVEGRIDRLDKDLNSFGLRLSGSGRGFESAAGGVVQEIERTEATYALLPRPINFSTVVTAFAVDTTWRTVASTTIPVPNADLSRVRVSVLANAQLDENVGSGAAQFIWPFPTSTITSEYGMRLDPVTGVWSMHNGIDFSFPGIGGTSIPAPANGTVAARGFQAERGNWIELSHPGGLSTRYYHLQAPSPLSVGDPVTQTATSLGLVGTTGASTGNHLHWETLVSGVRMNPRDFMDIYGVASGGSAQKIEGRILVGSLTGPLESQPPMSGAGPGKARQVVRAVFGGDVTAPSTVTVSFQLRSLAGPVSVSGAPSATLTVIGSVQP